MVFSEFIPQEINTFFFLVNFRQWYSIQHIAGSILSRKELPSCLTRESGFFDHVRSSRDLGSLTFGQGSRINC